MNDTVYVVLGPTATGKTDLAVRLAKQLDGEVVTADSAQIYRGMDIGTAKPTTAEQAGVPHHMIDIVAPDEDYSAAQYQQAAKACIGDICSRGKTPIVAGGTGLYINALTYDLDFSRTSHDAELRGELEQLDNGALYTVLEGLDSKAAARIHPNNRKRVIRAIEIAKNQDAGAGEYDFQRPNREHDFRMIGLSRDREVLYARIDQRVDSMMRHGLLHEVKGLVERYGSGHNSMQAIGYKEIISYLQGETTLEQATDLIKRNTRRFAKRQNTWFKRDVRIVWFDIGQYGNMDELLESINTKWI